MENIYGKYRRKAKSGDKERRSNTHKIEVSKIEAIENRIKAILER